MSSDQCRYEQVRTYPPLIQHYSDQLSVECCWVGGGDRCAVAQILTLMRVFKRGLLPEVSRVLGGITGNTNDPYLNLRSMVKILIAPITSQFTEITYSLPFCRNTKMPRASNIGGAIPKEQIKVVMTTNKQDRNKGHGS